MRRREIVSMISHAISSYGGGTKPDYLRCSSTQTTAISINNSVNANITFEDANALTSHNRHKGIKYVSGIWITLCLFYLPMPLCVFIIRAKDFPSEYS